MCEEEEKWKKQNDVKKTFVGKKSQFSGAMSSHLKALNGRFPSAIRNLLSQTNTLALFHF